MITFITAFKEFDDYYGAIQRSALFSYETAGIPVIAPDNVPNAEKHCSKFKNVSIYNGVKTAKDLGYKNTSPLLNDMLKRGTEQVTTPLVGLINCDVLIPEDFLDTLKAVVKKYGEGNLIVVTRHDIDLFSEIDTVDKLKSAFEQESKIYDINSSSDLFIASRNIFRALAVHMPNFILGRYAWDNWLHYKGAVHHRGYNGTKVFKILHCRHTHSHIEIQEGRPGRKAPSSVHNIKLLEDMRNQYGAMPRINTWPYLEL